MIPDRKNSISIASAILLLSLHVPVLASPDVTLIGGSSTSIQIGSPSLQGATWSAGSNDSPGDLDVPGATPVGRQLTTGQADIVMLEAEHGSWSGGMWEPRSLAGASGGITMVPSTTRWQGDFENPLAFTFQVTTPGYYHVNIRARSDSDKEKSVWVLLNGERLPTAGDGRFFFADDWEWNNGHLTDSDRARLGVGSHTVELVSREAGLMIDKLIVTERKDLVAGSYLGAEQTGESDSSSSDEGSREDVATSRIGIGLIDHSVPVSLPSCDAADAVRITPSAGNIHLLSGSGYRVFCIEPGDYRGSGVINIRGTSGSASAPRIIRLFSSAFSNDGVVFGEWPARNQALMPSLVFTNSDHWIVDSLTFTGLASHAIALWNSDDVVINRVMVRESDKGINIKHGSDNNIIQNSFFADMTVNDGTVCIGLNSFDTPHGVRAAAVNNRIVNNEIRNCVDGIQFVAPMSDVQGRAVGIDGIYDSSAPLPGDFSGALIAGNDIYTTPDYYTNCQGTQSRTGICGMTENALDIKTASRSAANPVRILDNRFWGFRTNSGRDPLTVGSNDPGSAVVIHFGASKHIEIARNIIWDSTQGISVVRGASQLTIRDNVISDMAKRHGRYGDSASGVGIVLVSDTSELAKFGTVRGVEMTRNHIADVPSSVTGVPGRWGAFSNVQSSTARDNVSVNAPAANGSGWVGSDNTFGLSKSEAKFAQLCFRVRTASISGGQSVCLNDVLRTGSSPLPRNGADVNYWHVDNW